MPRREGLWWLPHAPTFRRSPLVLHTLRVQDLAVVFFGNKLRGNECAASCSHAGASWSGLSLILGRTQVQPSCMTHQPGRADDTSIADPAAGSFLLLCLKVAAGPVPRSSALPALDGLQRVLNQTSSHPTGREAPEQRCCTCLCKCRSR